MEESDSERHRNAGGKSDDGLPSKEDIRTVREGESGSNA